MYHAPSTLIVFVVLFFNGIKHLVTYYLLLNFLFLSRRLFAAAAVCLGPISTNPRRQTFIRTSEMMASPTRDKKKSPSSSGIKPLSSAVSALPKNAEENQKKFSN